MGINRIVGICFSPFLDVFMGETTFQACLEDIVQFMEAKVP
jgi:hypothetical protein